MRRHRRVRGRVHGTVEVPRLMVFRSNQHLYATLIDDEAGKVLLSCSDRDITTKTKKKPLDMAKEIGGAIADKAKAKKGSKGVFEPRGNKKFNPL